MSEAADPTAMMARALKLARRGEGKVEPNPMVGCVIVAQQAGEATIIGEGWHQRFGGPHAEVEALNSLPEPSRAAGATVYVTLEPCSHIGKTGPCAEALIAAKVGRVVVASLDPNPLVSGQGIERLRAANINVEVGLLENKARQLLAPYLMRTLERRPWVIAKWAMTLDGKIATASGDSKWISNQQSRAQVHQLRGRVDAIIVGSGTALADNPRLTVRPPGDRVPKRIVIDSRAQISLCSYLVETAAQLPTLIAVGPEAAPTAITALQRRGCEVFGSLANTHSERLRELLKHLADEGATNVLVEGGQALLGSFRSLDLIDEVHGYLAPKLLGGIGSLSPVGGDDPASISAAQEFSLVSLNQIEQDVHFVARRVRA